MPTLLRPGLLVALRTSVRGGIVYERKDLPAVTLDNGEDVARWETTRIIIDPAEYERATKARGRARTLVSAACRASSFGLLCPMEDEPQLIAALRAAQQVAIDFNATSTRSKLDVNALIGRIADSDAEAARAIAAEMRELLDSIEVGVRAADVERIREAANRARALGGMLTPETAGRVTEAIAEARRIARQIAKRAEIGASEAAAVFAELKLSALDAARASFLDFDADAEAEALEVVARPVELPTLAEIVAEEPALAAVMVPAFAIPDTRTRRSADEMAADEMVARFLPSTSAVSMMPRLELEF